MNSYELRPANGQKSFYGKAIIELNDDGSETLYSYDTKILTRDPAGKITRHFNGIAADGSNVGFTNTTLKHIKSFCGLNKADFIALPYNGRNTDLLTPETSLKLMIARRGHY